MKKLSVVELFKKIHEDEDGTVSLETILIIGAIALVILAFLLVSAWPKIKNYFNQNLEELTNAGPTASQ
jgi:Flp pilus assembly pilin Flp